MRSLNWLILTDHSGHSLHNSMYALTRTLAADARTASVFVASRGDGRNAAFFGGALASRLYGRMATPDFSFDPTGAQFTESPQSTFYGEADVVWLRLPPPADPVFFAHLTSYAPASAPSIVNHPTGILETGSKAFLTHFPDFTPAVRRVQSTDEVQRFAAQFPVVLKPLREYGGKGLVRILDGMAEVDDQRQPLDRWLKDNATSIEAGDYLAMKYLKNVTAGDKRILVVNGNILGASLRLPAAGQWLCNVAKGGTSVVAETTPEEEAMVAAIAPVLLERGVVIFGADTLLDDAGKRVLSELNTNSIGGFPQAQEQTGRPILQQTIDGLYGFLTDRI